jgi:hypothetical protein
MPATLTRGWASPAVCAGPPRPPRALVRAAGRRLWRRRSYRAQVARPLPERGSGCVTGSLLAAPPLAAPARPRARAPHRSTARAAAHRPADADALAPLLSTVGDVLRRLGLGRLPSLTRRPPIVRYERATASPATGPSVASARAGTTCTWPSITHRGSPTATLLPDERPPVR